MKTKVRVLALSVACVMLLSQFTGCGSTKKEEETTAKVSSDQTTKTEDTSLPFTKLKLYCVGAEPEDTNLVFAEANKIIKKEINAEVEHTIIPLSDYKQKYPILLASGEPFDIIFTAQWCYLDSIANGAYLPLNNLLEKYGQHLLKEIPKMGWEPGTHKGEKYMVPQFVQSYAASGLILREDLRKKYNTPEPVDYASLLTYFKAIKENEKGMIPYNASPSEDIIGMYTSKNNIMGLADFRSVIGVDMDTFTKVSSALDDPKFMDFLKFTRECYKQGYWSKSVLSNKVLPSDSFVNNKSATVMWNITKAEELSKKISTTIPGGEVNYYPNDTDDKVLTTGFGAGLSIYQKSPNPERAMMYLNLTHSNKDLYQLYYYGIKGKHYDIKDGKFALPEGVTQGDVKYANLHSLAWGLQNDNYEIPAEQWPRLLEVKDIYKNKQVENKIISFRVNKDEISAEYAAVVNTLDTYYVPLLWGVEDTEKGLAQLKEKLKAADLDKVLKEIQKQLDEYNAARK